MKFLKDERINIKDGEIDLTMRPVTTSQQARLIDLGALIGVANRIELTRWCLKNCVEKISINNADFEPANLADHADISDQGTLLVMLKIGVLVCDSAFAKVDDVKK